MALASAAQYLSDAMGAASESDAARELESLGRMAGLLRAGKIDGAAFKRGVEAMHARLVTSVDKRERVAIPLSVQSNAPAMPAVPPKP